MKTSFLDQRRSRPLTRGAGALVVGVVMVAATPPAAAAPPRGVGISHVVYEGTLPQAARTLLLERLREGLARSGLPLVGPATPPNAPACTDAACYQRRAEAMGARYLVGAKVIERQKSYTVQLELVSATTGKPAGAHEQQCQICGLSEAGERMSLAASALTERLRALEREPARLVIRSKPGRARVELDGKPRGEAPVDLSLPGGMHQLVVAAPGYKSLERSVEVVAGVDQTLDLELVPIPSEFPYRRLGWSALGVGAAAVVAGIVVMTVHGAEVGCKETEKDMEGDCPKLINSAWLAAGLMGGGAILGTMGGVWLSMAPPAEPGASARLQLNLTGRF